MEKSNDKYFRKKKNKIEWSEVGCMLLQNLYNTNVKLYDKYEIYSGLNDMYPIYWKNCVDEFINKPYDNYNNIIRDFQPLVILVNSVYKKLESNTEKEILNGNMPINYFIKKSFSNLSLTISNLYTGYYIVNYGNKDYISNSIIKYKCWEPNLTNIFNSILNEKNDNVVFDIGCNIGYYSIICSNKCKSIYSFDGNISNIYMLSMSTYYNNINNIIINHNIVSDIDNQYFVKNNQEIISKNNNIGGLNFKLSNEYNYDAKSISLDNFINKNNIQSIDILKIDVEGHKLNVLKGLINTIKSNIIKYIIIELSPCFNDDSYEILTILKNSNYNIYNIQHKETGKYIYDNNYLNNVLKYEICDIKKFIKSIDRQTNVICRKL